MEIERKYLLGEIPEGLNLNDKHSISQGYISNDPVVRIRKYDDEYILTIKSRGLIERIEIEKPLSYQEFSELSTMVRGNLIEKDRYKIPLDDGYTLELDVFHGIYEGLIIAEIEYESIEKAESYKAPGYLYCDVSEYPEYQNSSLSTMSPDEIRELLEKSRRLTS